MRLLTELKHIVAIEKTVYKSNLFNTKTALKIVCVNSADYSREFVVLSILSHFKVAIYLKYLIATII